MRALSGSRVRRTGSSAPFALLGVAVLALGVGLAFELLNSSLCTTGWDPSSAQAADRCATLLATNDVPPTGTRVGFTVVGAVLAVTGAVVADRQRRNPVGWLLLALGVLLTTGVAASHWAWHTAIAAPGSLPGERAAAAVADMTVGAIALYGLVACFLLVFPDGRPMRRWRPVLWVTVVATTALWLLDVVRPGPMLVARWEHNPLGVSWVPDLELPLLAVLAVCLLAGLAHAVLQVRRSRGADRQRLWPVVAAAGATVLVLVTAPLFWASEQHWVQTVWAVLFVLAVSTIPITTGAAVLRNQLYDVDLVVNRTLVFTALAGFVLLVHVLAVAGVGAAVSGMGLSQSALPLVATAVAASAFEPVRRRLQRSVDRLMYGYRREPATVLAQLAEQLHTSARPAQALEQALRVTADGLRLPYAAVDAWSGQDWRPVAAVGTPTPSVVELALTHQEQQVGRVRLGEARPGDLQGLDERVRRTLSQTLGAALDAVLVSDDLARSREQLVHSREEERQRLRRELHDGLGATLAGLRMSAAAIDRLVDQDPRAARALLATVGDDLESAGQDLRRLVDGLRPPALDHLGLTGALREQVERLAPPGSATTVDLLLDEGLGPLPAAVEVAAFRIVSEALTNVVRHAGAGRCTVTVRVRGADALLLEVCDDGAGLPDERRPGIGMLSMAERAREVGGRVTVRSPAQGGTVVEVQLPLQRVTT